MRTLARRLWDAGTLADRHAAIQGAGKVGSRLARHLAGDGCRLTIADVSDEAVRALAGELGAAVAQPHEIHRVPCDVFSPCALGGALSALTIPDLACRAVCGCANNQLATPEDGERLAGRGVVYAPDYIVNAGGVINISHEAGGYDRRAAFDHAWRIGETLERVLDLAEAEGVTTARAADMIAEQRLEAGS
jgi:leucine dehydrogenase